jgi:hypothetical protein
MADNPYAFARRESITVDDINMLPPSGSAESLESLKYPSDIIARLTRLSIPNSRRTLTFDTAKVPAPLAARLSTAPVGELFFVRNDNELSAMTVTARSPNAPPPEEAAAAATQIFEGAQAKIVYTNGFVPAHKAQASATLDRGR